MKSKANKMPWLGRVVGVDLDESLVAGTLWDADDAPLKINHDMVALIKEMERKGVWIFLFTARGEWLAEATLRWMHMHNIYYPLAMRMKPPADMYICDKTFNPNDYIAGRDSIVETLDKMSGIIKETSHDNQEEV